MPIRFSIVGRPNVGKSTLFNRLIGKRQAIVSNLPGVTRDYQVGTPRAKQSQFVVVDTAGIDTRPPDALNASIQHMAEKAIADSDAYLFIIDARDGIVAAEYEIAQLIRRQNKPVIFLANKTEGRIHENLEADSAPFGWEGPLHISAEHGLGFDELQDRIDKVLKTLEQKAPTRLQHTPEDSHSELQISDVGGTEARPLKIAIVGRPNAGKSSLINAILDEERVLTGATPGITRDSVAISCTWLETNIRLYDTAGMRKRAKIIDNLEKDAFAESLRAIRFSEVTLVLFDATTPLEAQDLRIADLAEREGRAVLLVANKWDLVKDRKAARVRIQDIFDRSLPQLNGLPLLTISALNRQGLKALFDSIMTFYWIWNKRISTSELNRWLEGACAQHPPPALHGRRIKIRYISQINIRPPSFLVKCSNPKALPASYRRYLVNGLRKDFGLGGTPIRLMLRSN